MGKCASTMGRVVIERSTERSRAAEAGLKKGARRATTLLQLDDLNDQLNPRKAMSNAASALVTMPTLDGVEHHALSVRRFRARSASRWRKLSVGASLSCNHAGPESVVSTSA